MKLPLILLALGLGFALAGCTNQSLKSMSAQGSAAGEDEEIHISLDQVPDEIKDAALAAVPGIVLEEASKEIEDGFLVYEVEGRAGGKEYEIEISADGKVLEVEQEGDDEDEDDGEQDDD